MSKMSLRPDPAPSRWAYRFQRWMLTPFYRRLLRYGLPVFLIASVGLVYFGDQARRAAFMDGIEKTRRQIVTRPELMVRLMAVEGASAPVEELIREIMPFELPASSFDLDLEAIHRQVEAIPAVKSASLRLRQGGVLALRITERKPVAVWRHRNGLSVVSEAGIRISDISSRDVRAALPVIAGAGADEQVPEALALLAAAAPIAERVIGLVRMGERRWDLVLDRDQRILLPEKAPVRALERVIAMHEARDMLERDLVAVDMRLGARPTIRMQPHAVEEWWRVVKIQAGTE